MRFVVSIILLSIIPAGIFCQDIEQVIKAKPATVNGGVSLNTGWYLVDGVDSRRDPFNWGINANLNFNFYGVVDAPFSVVINKGDKKLNRPNYSNFGISPKYKEYILHVGYRSLNFSSLTYSGLTFLGAGFEYQPVDSWVKFSCFYGMFNKATPFNFSQGDMTEVVYARRGWGSKITIGKNKHIVDLIVFKAIDNIHSVDYEPDSINTVMPEENLVLGLNSTNKITQRLSVKLEYALSFLSDDIRLDKRDMESYPFINYTGDLFEPRFSTCAKNAFSGAINYQGEGYSVGLSYKRIAPEYRSLGTSYTANDNEDWLINLSKSFLKNKINANGSFGLQRDNLDKTKETTSKRIIGSLNASFVITESLNLGLNYANFSSNSQSVLFIEDSVKFIQTTVNKGVTLNYNTGTDKLKHTFGLAANFQKANTLNQNSTQVVDNDTKVNSCNGSYAINVVPAEISLNTALTYTEFKQDSILNSCYGPTVGTGKAFFKKSVQTNLSFSFLQQKNTGNQNSTVTLVNLNISYRFYKKHAISLSNSVYFRNTENVEENSKVNEWRGNITYSYSF